MSTHQQKYGIENGIQFLLEADGEFGMESCACEKPDFRKTREGKNYLKGFPFSCWFVDSLGWLLFPFPLEAVKLHREWQSWCADVMTPKCCSLQSRIPLGNAGWDLARPIQTPTW